MDMAGFGAGSKSLPEMGLAVRAYAPLARSVSFGLGCDVGHDRSPDQRARTQSAA
jgi:hypothetical protein